MSPGIYKKISSNVENEDIYGGYDEVGSEYNLLNLTEDKEYQEALRNVSWDKHSINSRSSGTSLNATRYSRQNTPFPRPMTAVRAAGYTSSQKKILPYTRSQLVVEVNAKLSKEESSSMQFRNMEKKITDLLEECYITCAVAPTNGSSRSSSVLLTKPDYSLTLAKAREASALERALIRMHEESGHKDHNLKLTFAVLYNMAMQYTFNEMYEEALNAYTLLIKNKLFPHANRLKINMGNIYFEMGQYKKAIKMYHMALDQVPITQIGLRIKIAHNLAATFVKMERYQDACTNLVYIMSEITDTNSGLRLVLCYYALRDVENMKLAFRKLLKVDLNILNTEIDPVVDPDLVALKDVTKSDDLSNNEKKLKRDAARCILLAARIISPVIEDTYIAGFNWCVDCIKDSWFRSLAHELEMHTVIEYLKHKDISQAIRTLNVFEKKDDKIAQVAAVNLSFIYHLQGQYATALKYTTKAKSMDVYSAPAFVNDGACKLAQGNIEEAKVDFMNALLNDVACVEAIYNLGLVHKSQGQFDLALECFNKLQLIYSNESKPSLLYQLAHLHDLKGDFDAAKEYYQQIITLKTVDPCVLQKMGVMYERDNDKEQAFTCYSESHRYFPMNFAVIDWLGSHYVDKLQAETAHTFYEKAVMASPNTIEWHHRVARCYRKTGNYQKALAMYKTVHERFPENIECLSILVEMCSNQGLKDAEDYAATLRQVERVKAARERLGCKTGSRGIATGRVSRPSSPRMTKVPFNQDISRTSDGPLSYQLKLPSRPNVDSLIHTEIEPGSTDDKEFSSNSKPMMLGNLDYEDPLGPLPERPRTVMKLGSGDAFGSITVLEELLPP